MARKIIFSVMILCMGCCGQLLAEKLSDNLPAATALYLEVDVPTTLNNLESYVKFIDEDVGAALVADIKEMHACFKELAAAHEFTPAILDNLQYCNGYLVLLRRSEPLVITRTIQVPKFNEVEPEDKDFNEEPQDYEETPRWTYADKEITETVNYDFSFVIEANPEEAEEFISQLITVLNFVSQKETGTDFLYHEVDVNAGRLIQVEDENVTFGFLDKYIVISSNNPQDLWAYLQEPADPSLADINLNKRYEQAKQPSLFRLLTDIGAFVKDGEEELRKKFADAKQEAEAEQNENADNPYSMGAFKVRAAEQVLKTFELFKTVFSIDRMRSAGADIKFQAGQNKISSHSLFTLEFEPPYADGLTYLFDGGAPLQPPQLEAGDSCVVMFRLGIREIYEEVIMNLEEKSQQSFLGMMMLMKMQVGYDLSDLLPHLSGDAYLYVDIEETEHESIQWNEEAEDFEEVMTVGPMPKFMLMQGLNDPEAFAATFSDLFTRLAATPETGQFIRKKVYQETDVYIVGPDAGKADADPDGLYNYAIVNIDRYLSTGSWEAVTELIRRVKAAEKPDPVLSQLIEKNPGSNLLIHIPEAFQRSLIEMTEENQAEQQEMILASINDLNLGLDDEALTERFKAALAKYYQDFTLLNEKALPYIQNQAISGKLKDNYYEIQSQNEIRK
ncbi:MAG: hypothetical protein JXA52_04140 [Planctomycetes bacterium]|nr:hypothetical protein [Planctomycetota bacterium]